MGKDFEIECAVLFLVTQLCPTLYDSMDCNLPSSSLHGDSPGKNTGVGCHALIYGIFSTQGSNPGLLHCWWILYHLSHQGRIETGVYITESLCSTTETITTWLIN